MVGNLLLRGMLIGVLAGILAFGFARIFGEPAVDLAIAFEEASGGHSHGEPAAAPAPAAHSHAPGEAAHTHAAAAAEPEPELVSRGTQAGAGLLTGMVVYGAAMGGLFALAFAFVNGRMGNLSPRATAGLLALCAFVAIILVPGIKYPANPPAVGDGATIGLRTRLFFTMLVVSLAAMTVAWMLARRVIAQHGGCNAAILAAAVYLAIVVVAQLVLPTVNEVPDTFSATLLWQFRTASLGIQLVLWTTLGVVFGAVVDRSYARALPRRAHA